MVWKNAINRETIRESVFFWWGFLRELKPEFMFNIKFMNFYYDDRSFCRFILRATDEDVVKVFALYLFKSHENGKRVNERLKFTNCSLRFKDIRYIIGKWIAIAFGSQAYGDNQNDYFMPCKWLRRVRLINGCWRRKRIFKSINRQIEFIQSINISYFQRIFINSELAVWWNKASFESFVYACAEKIVPSHHKRLINWNEMNENEWKYQLKTK